MLKAILGMLETRQAYPGFQVPFVTYQDKTWKEIVNPVSSLEVTFGGVWRYGPLLFQSVVVLRRTTENDRAC